MTKKTSDYWRKRFEILQERQLNKGVETYHEIAKQYDLAIRETEKQISAWYNRFATENKITLTEAKKLLAGRDLEAFRMDVKEYIKKGQSLDPQWLKQLEQASVRVHVSRLEALKVQMQQEIEKIHGHEVDALDQVARDIYIDGYYRTAFEVAKGSGVGTSLAALDTAKIDKVISKPWTIDNRTFSSRVWGNRSKLVDEVHTLLTQNIIRGQAPDKVIKAISKRFDVSKSAAGRLVMTESAYFNSVAQQDSFKDVGVKEFEFVATLDSHTSEICEEMDGKHFKMSEWEVGTNVPPLHCYCRSTTVPYFEDLGGERASRDEEGKYKTVPADMTYKEWKKAFVGDGVSETVSTFVAAKTLEEAKAYSDKFVKDGKATWGKANNLDNINEFNRTLEELTTKYGESEFDTIGYAPRGNFLAHANGQLIETHGKFINGSKERLKDIFERNVTNFKTNKLKNIQEFTEKYLNNPAYKHAQNKVKKTIRTMEKGLNYSRHNVFTSAETMIRDTITHEYGHSLMFRAIEKEIEASPKRMWNNIPRPSLTKTETKAWKSVYNAYHSAIGSNDIYKISEYASTNMDEFFAETFTMRELGEDLPDYIKRMLKEVTGK